MKERNIKITVEYDGTDFNGWQVQKHGERTVQGEIKNAIHKIFDQDVSVIGSGRTDSGVHAFGQVANFKIKSSMPCDEIARALNGNLPKDISVVSCDNARKDFHAQYRAKTKTYRYTILNSTNRCSIRRNFCLYFPYKLNLKAMREEAKFLVGKHDFKSFQASDNKKKDKISTIRKIKRLGIKKTGDYIQFEIEANGFLYKMVRNIVGTLIEIGNGKIPKRSIKQILKKKDRTAAGYTAPAKGLCLLYVKYN